MFKIAKKVQVFALIFILSAVIVAAGPSFVKAQSQATIDILVSTGVESTTPAQGSTTTYADGTAVTLSATAGEGFVFQSWEIISAAGGVEDLNNPTTLTVTGGVTYAIQAVCVPIQTAPNSTTPDLSTAAIVVILPSVGGTTNPPTGTYALAVASQLNLQATADSGWTFDHWAIGGVTGSNPHGGYSFTDTPTDNPYNVNHGYGNTYTYQAVFKPNGSVVPEYSSVAAVIIALALVAVTFGTYAYKRKNK